MYFREDAASVTFTLERQPEHQQEKPVFVFEEPNRDRWSRKVEFLLSSFGFCVGYGNIWRFPYLCLRNGGGGFLIPYFVFLVFGGIPIFFLEQSVGQLTQSAPVHAWNKLCPLLRGIGFASIVISFLVSIYYNVIVAWSLFYFFKAFKKDIPWLGCHHPWNTADCYVYNASDTNATGTSSSEEFLAKEVLKVSSGIDEPGALNLPLAISLLVAWVLVYFCVWKGVRSMGKVAYVTATAPFFVLVTLFIRGITLPGAKDGVEFYLLPSWEQLAHPQAWIDAAAQVLLSFGMGMGVNLTFASYNNKQNDIMKDSFIISIANCVTSVFAGFTIFSILGFVAGRQDKTIDELAAQGPDLVFIALPAALAQLPVPQVWAVLFMFMLIMLGLDTQVNGNQLGLGCIEDISRSNFTDDGSSLVDFKPFFDMSCKYVFVLGAERFSHDVEDMIGRPISKWWFFCWKFISPLSVLGVLVFRLITLPGIKYEDYTYPLWGEILGWLITAASLLLVPVLIVKTILDIYCCRKGGEGTAQSLHEATFVPYEIRAPNVKHTETGSLSPVYLSA
ncbi:PREDICTED: sodium- and chloride-dependent GABA transporter 1-like [Acropora digitifera]|uniref:sodium- and chloride-dependent GABA transporter 1-like n=1 Tax=Acropora digitifera TaxID=70779 RepID=UPI00077A8387|nr:PREDICTED: sodium- and chloride-dependent GABA transporter 1-like [Acropora digitifera]